MSDLQTALSEAISNKKAPFKHDQTKSIKGPFGNKIGKKGREFYGYGRTGIAKIEETVSTEKTTLEGFDIEAPVITFDCEIPWTGEWALKNFIGVLYEHRKEKKSSKGVYQLKLKVRLIGGKIQFLEAKSLTDLGHDSRKMPVEALENLYLRNSQYLRDELFS